MGAEKETVDLISQLILAELLRKHKNKASTLTKEEFLQDTDASQVIADRSKDANNFLYGGLECRIKVAAADRQDLNARHGTLRCWDVDKEKFCVGLDTKQVTDSD